MSKLGDIIETILDECYNKILEMSFIKYIYSSTPVFLYAHIHWDDFLSTVKEQIL